ncbi:unnamed protein product [Prorocentrum cordatum]|uniref:Cyclic nucleotide-binding domain-containing protein n=1 Tax=Prorocentrum cordatum TaxID=2364126 RepID=A0ABN9XN98_9DINO|nr:unnamed protein product [Polarella glacialis]
MPPNAREAPTPASSAMRSAGSVELVRGEAPSLPEPLLESPQAWPLSHTVRAQSAQPSSAFDDLLGQLAGLHRREVQAMRFQLRESDALIQQLRALCGEEAASPLPHCAAHGGAPVAGPGGGGLLGAGSPPSRSDESGCPSLLYQESAPSLLKAGAAPSDGSTSPRGTAPQDAGPRASSASEESMQLSEAPSGKWTFAMMDAWKDLGDEGEEALAARASGRAGSMDLASRMRMFRSVTKSGVESSLVGSFWEATTRGDRIRCTWRSFIPASPGSPARLLWDFLGAVLIFYDLFKLPMETFSPPETALSKGMDWLILCFWTLNVFASLTVGYVEHGVVVLSMRKIVLRYVRTWLAVDLLVLVPDWAFTIVDVAAAGSTAGDDGDIFRLLRVLRLIRMVRLLRLLKLRRIFDTINDMIDSEYVSVIANIVKMILMLLVINHLICCMWYTVSVNQSGDKTWIKVHKYEHVDWTYKYATAFHWSITQFTPASMDVQPQNFVERVFTVVVVVFALVGFSYIVGSITGSLGQLRSMQAEESTLFWDLKRYLARNKVPRALSVRIQKYLEHAWQSQKGKKTGQNVKLVALLSEQLLSELKFEMAVPQMRIHPLLDSLIKKSTVTVHRLANVAIGHKLLAAGDYLFHPGETATHMYIVVEGKFNYARLDSNGGMHKELVEKAEDWIAEPALWTRRWVHCGLLKATEDSDNLTIDCNKFAEQVKLNPQAHEFVSSYALNFLEWLNNQDPDDLSDISQGEDVSRLFAGFIPHTTNFWGKAASATFSRANTANSSFGRSKEGSGKVSRANTANSRDFARPRADRSLSRSSGAWATEDCGLTSLP